MVLVGNWDVTSVVMAVESHAATLLWTATDCVGVPHFGGRCHGRNGLFQMEDPGHVTHDCPWWKSGGVQPYHLGILTRTRAGGDDGAGADSVQYGGHGGFHAGYASFRMGCRCLYPSQEL